MGKVIKSVPYQANRKVRRFNWNKQLDFVANLLREEIDNQIIQDLLEKHT